MHALPIHANGVDLTLEELLVYRGPASRHNPFLGLPRTGQRSGQNLSAIKGRGMEFDEVRRYQSGDDVRTIDWRVTARTGHAHTKLFREERERPVMLFVDLGQRLHLGSALLLQSVQAAHLAALVGWQSIAAGERLGGIICCETAHREHKPRARRQGIAPLLDSLVSIHGETGAGDEGYLNQGIKRLHHLAHPGGVILVISDGTGLTPAHLDILADLGRHSDIRLFQVTDPLATRLSELPKQISVPVWHRGRLARMDHKDRQLWQQQTTQQLDQFEQGCRQRGLTLSRVEAAQPLTEQLDSIWKPIH